MKRKFILATLASTLTLSCLSPVEAGYSIRNGKIVDVTYLPTYPVEEHYNMAVSAFEARDMKEANRQFSIVVAHFCQSSCYANALFYQGVTYFELREFDLSNESFSEYLKMQNAPEMFQEAIAFKYEIAIRFCCGSKRRMLGNKKLPKWLCGEALALELFDQVIAALPSHDLAAQALYAKGCLLWRQHDYKGAVEAYQTLIRRFPKHEKTPEAYLLINRVFLEQVFYEFQNPDILSFAEINYKRFQKDFPKDERLCEAKADVMAIKEVYANGLYQTGLFYEKLCKSQAASIYYQSAIMSFPDTNVAACSRDRLFYIAPDLACIIAPDPVADELSEETETDEPANAGEEFLPGDEHEQEDLDLEGISLEPLK